MAFYIYGVCESCGRVVSKDETKQSGDDTVDGKSYRKVSAQVCGCSSSVKKRVDIIGN